MIFGTFETRGGFCFRIEHIGPARHRSNFGPGGNSFILTLARRTGNRSLGREAGSELGARSGPVAEHRTHRSTGNVLEPFEGKRRRSETLAPVTTKRPTCCGALPAFRICLSDHAKRGRCMRRSCSAAAFGGLDWRIEFIPGGGVPPEEKRERANRRNEKKPPRGGF